MTYNSGMSTATLFFILSAAIAMHGAHSANIICEELPVEMCAFSVSSVGNRCVLEKNVISDGTLQFQCQSSMVMVEETVEWIESEECVNACGTERMSVGMSTDSLLQPKFLSNLCSQKCQKNCPNIVDLYFNLAAGEGISLPSLCEAQGSRSRRLIANVLSDAKTSSITAEMLGLFAYSTDSTIASAPSPAPSLGT